MEKQKDRSMRCILPILAMAGFMLSSYAYYVERRFARAQELGITYRAYCDVGIFSCTRVFSSEYGFLSQFLGLPKVSNAALGILFYLVELAVCRRPTLIFVMSAGSLLLSVVLFFILTVIMHDLCVVCCLTYVVNVLTCFLAWHWRKQRRALSPTKLKQKQKH